jgi:hypothetical protein
MFSLMSLILIGVAVWLVVRPTAARDAAAAQFWAGFHYCSATNGWALLYVHSVYKHGNRGSKAHVSIYGDTASASRDSWFWWHQVQPGSVVAVSGLSQGWGPHTRRDDVLYVGDGPDRRDDVQATFSARELLRAQRHWSRHQSYLGGARVA